MKKETEIQELKDKIADIKANCDLAIEGRDVKIDELEKENAELRAKYLQATDEGTSFAHLKSLERENTKLKEQIEKMKCCGNCSKYDRNNRICSRTKFSVIETLCNCSDDSELRR